MSQPTARIATRRAIGAALGLTLAGGAGVAFAGAAQADPNPNITICHATGAEGKWVVQTIDAAAITSAGHHEHQGARDVIPPFEYVVESSGAVVTYGGLNWDDNWATTGEGVATEDVPEDGSLCAAPAGEPEEPGTEEPEEPTTEEPGGEEPGEEKPIVQTDGVNTGGPDLALVAGGAGLLLAGGATLVLANRPRGRRN